MGCKMVFLLDAFLLKRLPACNTFLSRAEGLNVHKWSQIDNLCPAGEILDMRKMLLHDKIPTESTSVTFLLQGIIMSI